MTISIWRYSHLTLAISSFFFILIASLTGIVLAFEPISKKLEPYSIENLDTISVSETIISLHKKYDEIISLEIDENDFIKTSVITKEGNNDTFYVDPITGNKLGKPSKKKPIYKFATNLHRSLFLKSTGRFIIGFVSLLLCLIAVSGLILIIKRQGGFLKLFSKVIKENFEQYYHIIIGRYTLIPIIIITVTGIYLSLDKFSLLPSQKINHSIDFEGQKKSTIISPENFLLFKNTKLSTVKSIEFPFSEDEEDYFLLKLQNKELVIHQYSGAILSTKSTTLTGFFLHWSLLLHTGKGSYIWASILLLSCLGILFFIYSGFIMTFTRKKNSIIPKNNIKKDTAEFVILVGSETGTTYSFANSLYKALLENKQKVFITSLNNYTTYKNCKYLIILTATYGEGEAPINAKTFLTKIKNDAINHTIKYAVVGFGSMAYPKFCEYAIEVNQTLQQQANYSPILPIYKINNQSFDAFKNWAIELGKKLELDLHLKQQVFKVNKQYKLAVTENTNINCDNTFLVHLQPSKKIKYTSGDLLSIRPKEDNIERLYSIGKVNQKILLSIKKHEFGICSNYLNTLNKNELVTASIKQNPSFHFPKKAKEIVLIANGTGIAPFLGMLHENHKQVKTHLFWGGRTEKSYKIYSKFIEDSIEKKQLHNLRIAYSQENTTKQYVQDIIAVNEEVIISVLKNKGCILICGSVAMMNATFKVIEKITVSKLHTPIDYFKKSNQIKTDCY